jgi:hypothetical protein
MYVFARGVTFDVEVFAELVDLYSVQEQKKGSALIRALLCSV